jgi:hypothetical protein
MDSHARYSPKYADNDMTFDPNAPFLPDSVPRSSGAFRFPVDLNSSPDLCQSGSTAGHVTDVTASPTPSSATSAHHVFSSAFGVSMGDGDVSFPSLYVLCAL